MDSFKAIHDVDPNYEPPFIADATYEGFSFLARLITWAGPHLTADNIARGAVVRPARVVRTDDDDPYLVVAADKGTAAFSDLANSVAAEYGFWLGDAFASGGSYGYDHKKESAREAKAAARSHSEASSWAAGAK